MKRGNAILLSSALLAALLCGCGQAAPSAPVGSASSTVSSGAAGTSGSAGVSDATAPAAPTAEPAAAGQPISLLFSKATGVSREWQDGKFIINGLDASGNKICGIADSSGNAVLVDGYTALYPLADGHLLATTEADASGECDYEGRTLGFNSIGFAGVILDENLNVVYQPDASQGYERLYPINSHLILAIRAKTGFEGKTADLRVLDQNGQFLYDCTSESVNLADFMTFDDDGITWTISSSFAPVSFGSHDDLGENKVLKISIGSALLSYVFNSDSCASSYFRPNFIESSFYDPYNSSALISGGIHTSPNGTIEYSSWTIMSSVNYSIDLSAINSMQDSFNIADGIGIYYIGSDARGNGYFRKSELIGNTFKETYFSFDGRELPIPQNYSDSLSGAPLIVGYNMLLPLQGADGKSYIALFNPEDGSSSEPILVGQSAYAFTFKDSTLVIGHKDSLCLYNTENGQQISEIPLVQDFNSIDSLSFHGNTLVAACKDADDSIFYHIYSLTDYSAIL